MFKSQQSTYTKQFKIQKVISHFKNEEVICFRNIVQSAYLHFEFSYFWTEYAEGFIEMQQAELSS